MTLHKIAYHGRFQLNYERLKIAPANFQILKGDGSIRDVYPHSDRVTGMIFGNMERKGSPKKERFCVVLVDDIVLESPVDIDPERHTGGKGLGPRGCLIEDEQARTLLEDILKANPDQSQGLRALAKRYFPG